MEDLIDTLKWRYAVKKYDKDRVVSPDIFEKLKEVLRLVPTSNGLQPFKFLIIQSPEIREQLKAYSFNQSQIVDASHLIVFCSYKKLDEAYFDNYIQLNAVIQNKPIENFEGYSLHLKRELLHRTEEQTLTANEKQCYIALGQLLQAAAIYKVDASPIEGFIIEKYNEILNLHEQNLTATVVCALGYRSDDDHAQYRKKVRKDTESLFDIY